MLQNLPDTFKWGLRTTSTSGRHNSPAQRLILGSAQTDIQTTLIYLSLLSILAIVCVLT